MKKKNEKWKSLAADVLSQNENPFIKGLREFMTLSHLLGKYLDAELDVNGLNRTQRKIILYILSKNEPMTPTEISKLSHLSIDTINKSIDNLDKMGVTRSYRSRKDRRVRKVTLTEKGLEMVEKTLPLRHEAFSRIMGCLSEEEMSSFSDNIRRLLSEVSSIME